MEKEVSTAAEFRKAFLDSLVEVDLTPHGKFQLRSSRYVMNLISEYAQLSPREFVERLLRELIDQPPEDLDFIGELSDEVIERALRAWLVRQDSRIWIFSENDNFFEALQQAYKGFFEDRIQLYDSTLKIISDAMTDSLVRVGFVLDSFRTSMESIGTTVSRAISQIQPINLIGQLPGYSEIIKLYDDFHQAEKTLSENVPFMSGHWPVPDIASFLGIQNLDLSVRNAITIKKLLAYTSASDFKQKLQNLFQGSSVLTKRWTIIELVLEAHSNRNYVLAIPTLLAQFEGMFTDALLLRDFVFRENGKLYGKNKKGKIVKLNGLSDKRLQVELSNLPHDHKLNMLSEHLISSLIPERNDIMHGSSVNYAEANLSLLLVLGIYLLAIEFDHFENSTH